MGIYGKTWYKMLLLLLPRRNLRYLRELLKNSIILSITPYSILFCLCLQDKYSVQYGALQTLEINKTPARGEDTVKSRWLPNAVSSVVAELAAITLCLSETDSYYINIFA